MGLSTVTESVYRIADLHRMYATAIGKGRLWVVNAGAQVLPLAPKNPAGHAMHQLHPGKQFYGRMGDLTLQGVLR